ncbi:serine hydrolase domain-containing protein [Maribellus maritimus]|uniref:serine hydrolase domain-containing protein n=1 Tax=Maribellus maritimus TaxID=2870838 RepID=UPI001EECB730|nr:serine hydrolase domain-containing protein [Maribellus maritimus]MCG6186206.1 beta-lactamase family protein [Maribellus maritimus]
MNPTRYKSTFYPIVFIIIVFLSKGCSSELRLDEAHDKTEKLFQKELKKDNVQNTFLSVYSPSLKIDWNFAGGKFQNGEAVSDTNPFYTASIGKTFTATAISVLVEQGKLKFGDKISVYLPDSILKNIHIFEGKDYSSEITIAQLLQHTSGLPDYFEGETADGTPNIMEQMFADTGKFWEPAETIDFVKKKMQPLFAPGTDYRYTDTEYVLLGLIIQNISEMPLHDFFQKHFFEPLKMQNTYMNLRSKPIKATGKISELYAGDFEASTLTSLSADWAGGGLVSTSNDLNIFQHALFTGKIVSAKTMETMQNWVPETRGMEYGLGLRKVSFKKLFPTLPDLTIIGHSGSTSSFMYYCPKLDVYLAGTLNQTDEVKNSLVLMVKILSVINKTRSLEKQS